MYKKNSYQPYHMYNTIKYEKDSILFIHLVLKSITFKKYYNFYR